MTQIHQVTGREEASIPQFIETTKQIRKSLTEPITYRDLRKKAIRETLVGITDKNAVEECYEAWVQERHAAAERFLYDDAIETLSLLRQTYPDACLAAITNGAGNPLLMPSLTNHFDLRVSGEDDDVFPHRKPHSYIYEHTLQKADFQGVWCHVGDCLANDVGASAAVGAHAIWLCTDDDEESAARRLIDTSKVPEWSTASTAELEKRALQVEQGKAVVAAKINSLSELPDAIEQILNTV